MKRIVTIVAGVLAMLTLAATAQAESILNGTAEGVTMRASDGSYKMHGTYTDPAVPQGFGHYTGTFTEVTTGYTTCRDPSGIHCIFPEGNLDAHCNILSGRMTFNSGMKMITVLFGDIDGRAEPGVCQLPGTTNRSFFLPLFEFFGYASDLPTRGYGNLGAVSGFMNGTSVPVRDGVYADTFPAIGLFAF